MSKVFVHEFSVRDYGRDVPGLWFSERSKVLHISPSTGTATITGTVMFAEYRITWCYEHISNL